ncbi:MAG: tRNA (adenosine(37)-N6)-threonylcarbamoyltransferase complex transferase subunit TsaD [Candidatus Melainabacteria bacterium]|jgi:N6-L-threonylcarbamoyladenine synthase|nr:tRNA (adenosine(37)-N6)-threonylcarbamoyltransferase complex transferase subunit TsaD [Candidatus Melainabacteria bacterium]
MLVLGIETSCDETALAIVEDGRKVIANKVYSQIAKHRNWGGVIPELASRLHLDVINDLLAELFADCDLSMEDVQTIAVSSGPGLVGSLMVGANLAKVLAWLYNKPLVEVNHLHGHVCANFLDSDLKPPFLCMLASGGHTQIIEMQSYTNMKILAETVDDAAGEAFDKVARLMGLHYPGGPEIDRLAQGHCEPERRGNPELNRYQFPVAMPKSLDFSFSGLKTAVLRLKEKIGDETWEKDKAAIAHAFQETVAKTFYKKTLAVSQQTDITKIVLAGGVSANTAVRRLFKEKFSQEPYELVIPGLAYCTDNAAMIASAGFYLAQEQEATTDYSFEVYSRA